MPWKRHAETSSENTQPLCLSSTSGLPKFALLSIPVLATVPKVWWKKIARSIGPPAGMGIPVLHGVAGESAEIVEREGVGLVVDPENAQALCDGVLRLAQDQALYQELREHCLAAAPRYDRSALARMMLGVLEEVVQPKASADRS